MVILVVILAKYSDSCSKFTVYDKQKKLNWLTSNRSTLTLPFAC